MSVLRMVRRIADGAVLPVVEEEGEEICVVEEFPFWSPAGTVMKPLRLWHPRSRYEPVEAAPGGEEIPVTERCKACSNYRPGKTTGCAVNESVYACTEFKRKTEAATGGEGER